MSHKDTQQSKSSYQKFYYKLRGFIRKNPRTSLISGAFLSVLSLLLLFIQTVSWGLWTEMPDKNDLINYPLPQASEIYTVDGVLIGRYFLEDRISVPYDSLPSHLIDALLATEDIRFYEHEGIDGKSLIRVLFKTLLFQNESSGGGSTLSQQLAKNFYPREDFSILSLPVNKVKESLIASDLEEIYSKEDIIALYLNTVSFGGNEFGVEIAARNFFNKHVKEISTEEAALLVGMLKAPTYYSPIQHPARAKQRRNLVFSQMHKYGMIGAEEFERLKDLALELDYGRYTHHEGIAPYLRENMRLELVQWCKENPGADGKHYNLYKDGLKIYTSIHSGLQGYAEASMNNQMRKLQGKFDRHWKGYNKAKASKGLYEDKLKRSKRYKNLQTAGFSEKEIDSVFMVKLPMRIFTHKGIRDTTLSPKDSILHDIYMLQGAFMAIEPQNGFIRAWVGGFNHEFYQFDHVKSRRQTGSAFKPLVYAAALEEGVSPCEYIPNDKVAHRTYNNWSPRNSDNIYGGEYSMRGALTHSVNVAAVNLILKIGPQKVVDLTRRMGLSYDLPALPSIALGSADISLRDMLHMYAILFNQGKVVNPRYLLRMEDRNGKIIYQDPGQYSEKQIISPETSVFINRMLQDVVDEGTARSIRTRYKIKAEVAGKTGTTQEQSDGWFIGSVPGLLAGAWVGADDPRIHFRSLAAGQGAATALPIWAYFMRETFKDEDYTHLKDGKFPKPSQKMLAEMDCKDYWFPLNLEEFKAWYRSEFGEDEEEFIENQP